MENRSPKKFKRSLYKKKSLEHLSCLSGIKKMRRMFQKLRKKGKKHNTFYEE